MKSHKAKLKTGFYFLNVVLIFSFLIFNFTAFAAEIDDLRLQIESKQGEIQQLEKQIAAYKEQIKNQQSTASTLSKQVANMEAQIRKLQAEIQLTQTQISAASLKIEGLKIDINARNIEIQKQKDNLSETIRAINDFDQETSISLVLKNENFSDFLNQMQFVESLQQGLQAKLDEIKTLKKELEGKKNDIEEQKSALENFRNELSGKNLVLASQKDDKEDLLVQTKNQEKKYQTILSDLQKKREQIDKEIFQIEEKLRLAIDPNSIPGAKKGLLAWPIKGALTQSFGCIENKFAVRSYPACNGGKGGYHNGIDISADVGDPVVTALEGTVIGVGNLGKYAYGKWIAIKHDNGLTTMYGHLSVQSVSIGQKIKAGQVIGYAGSTGYSTGPHLHFTVYASTTFKIEQKSYGSLPIGGPVNPLSYL